MPEISWSDFERIELRVGTILRIEPFPEARKPTWKLWVDLGSEIGVKQSSAQITHFYHPDELVGQQVICLTNVPPRQIATFMSEILVTGFYVEDGKVVLAIPERSVPNGTQLA